MSKELAALERRVDVTGGYCLLNNNPSQNYGIASARIWFYVIGPKGAVQWQISTDWYTKGALQHLAKFPPRHDRQPQAWDIGYHSKEPMYEGEIGRDNCHLLGCRCYYDGSSLNADNWVEGFIHGGTDWLWPKLEQYYHHVFEAGDYPVLVPEPMKNPKTGVVGT